MFIYKKLFNYPSIFHNAEGGSTGNTDGGGSVNQGATPNGKEDNQQQSQSSQEGNSGEGNEGQQTEKTVPYTRFSELNKKQKELQTQLDNLLEEKKKAEKEKEKSERQAREKQGEFENLYTETKSNFENLEVEHTASKNRVEALEAVIQELLDSELNKIDKEHHDLIPDNLTVEEKLSWLSKAKSKGLFGEGKKEETPVGGPANPSQPTRKMTEMTPHELFKMAFSKK